MKDNERIYEDYGSFFYEDSKSDMVVNLTLLFGKGNEPKTIEEFKNMLPKIEPYNRAEASY